MKSLQRLRIVIWSASAVLIVAIAVALYWSGGGALSGTAIAGIGGPFTLVDQRGTAVTEAALKGHPSAIFFGYTFCPDVCPTTLSDMSDWLQKLGPDGDRLKVYFVTVDPERDTRSSSPLTCRPSMRASPGSPGRVPPSTRCSRTRRWAAS